MRPPHLPGGKPGGGGFPADIDISEQRPLLRELTSAQRRAAEATVTAAALGVPVAEITVDRVV